MSNPNNTITTARNFLKEKINSLKKDCEQCLFSKHPAPFPALLYCFSVIDLLGALFSGNAEDSAPTTQQSKDFITGVMKYPDEVAELMQKVFRHKLVHLAQPNPMTKYKGKQYLWWFCHESNRNKHLKIEPTDQKGEFWFRISLWDFVEDIEDSVFGSNGYMNLLLKNVGNSQDNFEKAYKKIHG